MQWRSAVPQPPFASVGTDVWEAKMPARGVAFPKHTIRIEADAITLDGTRIPLDQWEHFTVKPGRERGGRA